jgi:hypothetical protein
MSPKRCVALLGDRQYGGLVPMWNVGSGRVAQGGMIQTSSKCQGDKGSGGVYSGVGGKLHWQPMSVHQTTLPRPRLLPLRSWCTFVICLGTLFLMTAVLVMMAMLHCLTLVVLVLLVCIFDSDLCRLQRYLTGTIPVEPFHLRRERQEGAALWR